MTIEAFQYGPDKHAALAEVARILKPGGRAAIVCFEVDPVKVQESGRRAVRSNAHCGIAALLAARADRRLEPSLIWSLCRSFDG